MNVAWHGHYLAYFEHGRTELLRSLGVTYRAVEDAGTLLMVVEAGVKYERPARYDDLLTVRTRLTEARHVRLRFEYEVLRDGERLARGHTVLAAADAGGKPRRLPAELMALLGAPERGARQGPGPASKDR